MGFDFRPKEARRASERAEKGVLGRDDEHKRSLRRASGRDDTEFWVEVVFGSDAELARFLDIVGIDPEEAAEPIPGDVLAERCAGIAPDAPKKAFPRKDRHPLPEENDLAWVEIAESHSDMLFLQLVGALERLVAADSRPEPSIVAYFADRGSCIGFLASQNALKHGDKYLDGSAWLAEIEERIAG